MAGIRAALVTTELAGGARPTGGLGSYVERMAGALVDAGHRPEVFTFTDGASDVIERDGVRVHLVRRALVRPPVRAALRVLGAVGLRSLRSALLMLADAWLVARAVARVERDAPFDLVQSGLVCDWIVPPDDAGAAHALLAWLAECAREADEEALTALFPDTAPEWLAFQRAGLRARPTRYFLVGRNYVKRYSMIWLYHNWFYTLGDTDLC